MDLSPYQGLSQFGPAYRIMLEQDAHAPGSVDRVLMERMIRLCPETTAYLYAEYTPTEVSYQEGSRPELESHVGEMGATSRSAEEQIGRIIKFCSGLEKRASDDLDEMLFGGTEEEIIRRGSDWCTDLARVGCVLCQIAGLPARFLMLADADLAYSGHSIIEVLRSGVWGALDPTYAVVYRHTDGTPASTWELMNQPQLVAAHWSDAVAARTKIGEFKSVAISNYFVSDWEDYDYTVSSVNSYYRSILEMSSKTWPGGLRWLHGEDES